MTDSPYMNRRISLSGAAARVWLAQRGIAAHASPLSVFADEAGRPGVRIARYAVASSTLSWTSTDHDGAHLLFCSLSGALRMRGLRSEFDAARGQLISLSAATPCLVESRDSTPLVLLEVRLSREKYARHADPARGAHDPVVFSREVSQLVIASAGALLSSPLEPFTVDFDTAFAGLDFMLAAAVSTGTRADPHAVRHDILAHARTLIALSALEPSFGVETLAQELHVSTGHLHRVFRAVGSTPSKEIRRFRLEHAHRIGDRDAESGGDRSEIARAAGFRSRRQFDRASRAHTVSQGSTVPR